MGVITRLENVDFVVELSEQLELRQLAFGKNFQGIFLLVQQKPHSIDLSEGARANQLEKLYVCFPDRLALIEARSYKLELFTLRVHYQI